MSNGGVMIIHLIAGLIKMMLNEIPLYTFLNNMNHFEDTAQKMKFSITDFLRKCDQIRNFLQIWSHLLKQSLTETSFFCAVEDINDKVDLSNYATKADVKLAAETDTSKLTEKSNLASLKPEVDKLDIDKLLPFLLI